MPGTAPDLVVTSGENENEAGLIPVCIFAKPPVPGQVKTRLIPAFGAQAAAELASAMLVDTWAVVASQPNVRPVLAYAQNGHFPISVPKPDCWPQPEGDLGARIESILRRGLAQAPAVLAIGADTPLLTPDHLTAAVSSLASRDAVLGPAADGGFYLLGLSHCPAGLLSGLVWSSCETAAVTRTRLRSEGFHVAEIAELFDVDTVDDVRTLENALALFPVEAPATRGWLQRHFRYAL